jgi:hypothetical protein
MERFRDVNALLNAFVVVQQDDDDGAAGGGSSAKLVPLRLSSDGQDYLAQFVTMPQHVTAATFASADVLFRLRHPNVARVTRILWTAALSEWVLDEEGNVVLTHGPGASGITAVVVFDLPKDATEPLSRVATGKHLGDRITVVDAAGQHVGGDGTTAEDASCSSSTAANHGRAISYESLCQGFFGALAFFHSLGTRGLRLAVDSFYTVPQGPTGSSRAVVFTDMSHLLPLMYRAATGTTAEAAAAAVDAASFRAAPPPESLFASAAALRVFVDATTAPFVGNLPSWRQDDGDVDDGGGGASSHTLRNTSCGDFLSAGLPAPDPRAARQEADDVWVAAAALVATLLRWEASGGGGGGREASMNDENNGDADGGDRQRGGVGGGRDGDDDDAKVLFAAAAPVVMAAAGGNGSGTAAAANEYLRAVAAPRRAFEVRCICCRAVVTVLSCSSFCCKDNDGAMSGEDGRGGMIPAGSCVIVARMCACRDASARAFVRAWCAAASGIPQPPNARSKDALLHAESGPSATAWRRGGSSRARVVVWRCSCPGGGCVWWACCFLCAGRHREFSR